MRDNSLRWRIFESYKAANENQWPGNKWAYANGLWDFCADGFTLSIAVEMWRIAAKNRFSIEIFFHEKYFNEDADGAASIAEQCAT